MYPAGLIVLPLREHGRGDLFSKHNPGGARWAVWILSSDAA
jgi:hypothetical protein